MSIIYSAGALHQHYSLPSWVPDWTCAWHLAPFWATTSANLANTLSSRSAWTESLRGEYRAGGEYRDNFEVIASPDPCAGPQLRLSAIVLDTIVLTSESTPAPTPKPGTPVSSTTSTPNYRPQSSSSSSPRPHPDFLPITSTARYGRAFFRTLKEGYTGLATPGIEVGDVVAVLLGGDVPVVLRPLPPRNSSWKPFRLLCECFVQSRAVMFGEVVRGGWTVAEDVVLV